MSIKYRNKSSVPSQNGLWKQASEQIASLDDAAYLLRYAKTLEAEKDRLYQLKAKAISKAVSLVSRANGSKESQATTKKELRALADRYGYKPYQITRYSQVHELIKAADSQTRKIVDQEQYWLDALRRKPSHKYIAFAAKTVLAARQKDRPVSPSQVRDLWDARHKTFSPIIKPTDNWNFSNVIYPAHIGSSIPGEIYANAFWYFVQSGDTVVDPMAGGGMAKTVYDDRALWQGKKRYEFRLKMFDLNPVNSSIKPHNLLESFPVDHADYIFIDPPYWGMSYGCYSEHPSDIANFKLPEYLKALATIARHCANAQNRGELCTVLMSNYTDVKMGKTILLIEHIRSAWQKAGYELYRVAYASRHIQQSQTIGMANLNNIAKNRRMPLTDMVEVLTFKRL